MAYVDLATSSATITVATESALATNSANNLSVSPNSRVRVSGVVQAAAGTGGTALTVRVRQGSGTGGTALTLPASTVVSPAATAGVAAVVPFMFEDLAPPANGQYTVTGAFAGNTSSVVSSILEVEVIAGILA